MERLLLPGPNSAEGVDAYVTPAARIRELQDAAEDPVLPAHVREACAGVLRHVAALERWIDNTVIPTAAPGDFAEIMRRLEPADLGAAVALRRFRAGAGTEAEILRAFHLLRRALIAEMSRGVRT